MREIGNAEWIGTTARKQIARRDCVGRVLAVVTGAVYLQLGTRFLGENGFLVWLSQDHLPMHPRAIRGNFDFDALQTGMTFESDGECLRFGMGDHTESPLRFADARVWQPPMIDPGRVELREVVMARAREIKDLEGFRQDLPGFKKPGRSLIGLGEGLTPAGDDFIGGLLFAQWYLHQAYPDLAQWNQTAINDLIDYARARTNVISHAILCDHARGQSVEPMHYLIVALLHGKSIDKILPHVRMLLNIGNMSGREMLAGLLTGMLSIGTES